MRGALMRNGQGRIDAGKRGGFTLREKFSYWLKGASTVLVLFPDTRKRFLERTDAEALAGDWQRVGDDLWNAIRKYEDEQAANESQNKPSTKPSAPAQRQQGQAGPQVKAEFSGPLPPPDALEKYERVSPGAAERIIAMAETQSSHRHELEKSLVDSEYKQASKGQICAATLGALAIISGAIAGILGAQWTGSVIGGLVVVGLVSAFIRGRRDK